MGYNTTPTTEDSSIIVGASFTAVDGTGFVPFSALTSPQGLVTDDQIQKAYTDGNGLTQLKTFVYDEDDGWLDTEEGYEPCGDTEGLDLGTSVWFVSAGGAKSITTSGAVKSGTKTHTFTEKSVLCSSAFPVDFCPNSANVSWGIETDDQIQVAYTDDNHITQLRTYVYDEDDGWLDAEDGYRTLDANEPLVAAGQGFWLILQDAASTFTEVSPIAE